MQKYKTFIFHRPNNRINNGIRKSFLKNCKVSDNLRQTGTLPHIIRLFFVFSGLAWNFKKRITVTFNMKNDYSRPRGEIESLIYLLDDPDPDVQQGVRKRFRELGESAVPMLDQYRTQSVRDSEIDAIGEIIYSITSESIFDEYADVVERGIDNRMDLENALLVLCRFGNPTLRTQEYRLKLDELSRGISSKISYTPSMSEKMQLLLQYIFRELRFRGDSANYHHPDNAYLDRVIDRRKGLPIMLSVVVMSLAHRIGLPFYGVNMPIHFMLMYETPSHPLLIDPFDGGAVVTYNQCYYFLKKNGVDPRPEHLAKASELDVLVRCIRNLMNSYARQKDEKRIQDLRRLLQITEMNG
ncbi:MAG: hypothetical protein EA360_05195 [Balneolaceae bacterium]|nr:MAG: hypothetical protein EA360_05195 [Balneolaceae bacterium]